LGVLKKWALAISILWLALWAVALAAGLDPLKLDLLAPFDLMVLAGGPACLLACALLAIKRGRAAGSFLWLGSAVAAMGLGLRSGPHLKAYFLHMALVVLPQVVAASLFLLDARREGKKRKKEK
jgi:hypothetical protein